MAANANAREKLSEIQTLARTCHERLREDFRRIGFKLGGNLFLGKFYAGSDRLYFGPNPGDVGGDRPFRVELESIRNAPFDFPTQDEGEHRYWDNWKKFLQHYPDLSKWFNDRVTSSFLVPWRTANLAALYALDRKCSGKLFQFSGALVRRMLEHHEATIIIVAGKRALRLLNDLLDPHPWPREVIQNPFGRPSREYGAKGVYEWRTRTLSLQGEVTVLQIPHFSRAGGIHQLPEFVSWLRRELKSFGL